MPGSDKLWSRRDFVGTLGGAGLITALPGALRSAVLPDSETIRISILHTTDLHGHILPTTGYDGAPDVGGLARCVTQIHRWRRQNPNHLLIDVGDVYQGTDVALRTRGALMIDLFNHLKFDAWIIGNHEFDWGMDPFVRALENSSMPVLAANMSMAGRRAGTITETANPFSKVKPYILKEIAGIKIAIIGITTPGMPFWFRPDFIRDLHFDHPNDAVREAIAAARRSGADAVILAGHMGLKQRGGGDDFANNVIALTTEFSELPVFIAGHTHQLIPGRLVNNVLITQADHFGIHVGRVDLTFDRASKRLIGREAMCERMDNRVHLNHVVLSRAKPHLDVSDAALAEPVGELLHAIRVKATAGEPSDAEMLIGTAIREALAERGILIDGVFHGLFDTSRDIPAGPKTVADIWNILPYENFLVTAELKEEELRAMMDEMYTAQEPRSLIGFDVRTSGSGTHRKVTSVVPKVRPGRTQGERYAIALNTFDSRSAGHRFMQLRDMLDRPEARCVLHDVQTRDALIELFRRHGKIGREIWNRTLSAAA
ncbi:MAG: bifunctional metallophosphatase/5'-nucleotidase [Chthoniobacterales bacterium]